MAMLSEEYLREEMVTIARKMDSCGMNHGSSGNISVRVKDGILITPGSIKPEEIEPSHLLKIDLNGNHLETPLNVKGVQPSSEWRLHTEIHKERKEINSIVHCHSINATALACHGKGIPSFHYMTAVAGGANIRCAKYATFGTNELSINAIKALKNRFACLLAQHGQIAIGKSLNNALMLAIEVENLANIYLNSCMLGKPNLLSKKEMKNVLNKFKSLNYIKF